MILKNRIEIEYEISNTINPETQQYYFNYGDRHFYGSEIQEMLADNPNLCPEIQFFLVCIHSFRIKLKLARNPNSILEVQKILVADESAILVQEVAAYTKFGEIQQLILQDALLNHSNNIVQYFCPLFANRNLIPEIFYQHLKDFYRILDGVKELNLTYKFYYNNPETQKMLETALLLR